MKRLRDKVSIITGASRGIGKATAILFAREGSKVVIADVLEEEGIKTQKYINEEIPESEAIFIKTDVSKEDDVRNMVKETVEKFGGIDILVNNAGVLCHGTVFDTDVKTWNQIMDVNLRGAFLCCKYVVPYMIKRGGGAIINVCSYIGLMGGKGVLAYSASKAGLIGLTRSLALDLAPYNIRVNAVAPRTIDTAMYRTYRPPEQLKERIKSIPLRRLGKPEEVASVILFLASDEASYIFGEIIVIGGIY